ncbi:hypothetical protein LCGC14_2834380, partial [marine sediment metagenome]
NICSGLAASPGVVSGVAVWVDEYQPNFEHINETTILVAPMTDIKFVGAMRRAAAVITEYGGILCHAAVQGREIAKLRGKELPCVVGIPDLFKKIKDGATITVDGTKGEVYLGKVDI